MQTQFFRTPAMAFLYERGWRQNFNAAGFPGIDKEFAEAAEFFAPCADGGVVVDLSCGSGLMTRRLCRSGRYRRVLGLDYSPWPCSDPDPHLHPHLHPYPSTLSLTPSLALSLTLPLTRRVPPNLEPHPTPNQACAGARLL